MSGLNCREDGKRVFVGEDTVGVNGLSETELEFVTWWFCVELVEPVKPVRVE